MMYKSMTSVQGKVRKVQLQMKINHQIGIDHVYFVDLILQGNDLIAQISFSSNQKANFQSFPYSLKTIRGKQIHLAIRWHSVFVLSEIGDRR